MENNIDNIIAKILSGEATDSEAIVFDKWIESDEMNSHKFLEIKAYWCSSIKFNHSIDLKDARNKLLDRIQQYETVRPNNRRKYIRILSAIASAAACLLGLFYVMQQGEEKVIFYEFKTTSKIDTIVLPDLSKVILNKHSCLTYSNIFSKENRIVQLDGEALFDVNKDEDIPFVIELEDNTSVTVLGTVFSINSYTQNNIINVNLLSGSVKFQSDKNQITLSPNQKLLYNKENKQVKVIESDSNHILFWLNGIYKYQTISLEKLVTILSEIYNIEIQLKDRELANTMVSGAFYNTQTIDEILSVISRSLPIKWKYNNNKIIIN
ncbi:FecR family protein [Dysgonomonas sp. ZJ709]|uniref:FecR family protein n=1 Tax=Dysgonomonas sp. ZJ709 TaxID=2709797 RepID=UPI0013EBE6F4|nr:FecR family protein [Dysgonomonas sp. ZJ709]